MSLNAEGHTDCLNFLVIMEHIGISAGFRTCICPVCGIPVHQDQISHHVELHFGGTTTQDQCPQMDFTNYSSNSLHGEICQMVLFTIFRCYLPIRLYHILGSKRLELLHLRKRVATISRYLPYKQQFKIVTYIKIEYTQKVLL